MTSERIKEIQQGTSYPESVGVYKALLKVWNECEQSKTITKKPPQELVEKFTLITSVSHPTNVQIYKSAQQCAQIAVDYAEEENQEMRELLEESVKEIFKLKYHYKDVGHAGKFINKVEQFLNR